MNEPTGKAPDADGWLASLESVMAADSLETAASEAAISPMRSPPTRRPRKPTAPTAQAPTAAVMNCSAVQEPRPKKAGIERNAGHSGGWPADGVTVPKKSYTNGEMNPRPAARLFAVSWKYCRSSNPLSPATSTATYRNRRTSPTPTIV